MNLRDISYHDQATLANCESEPIHIPGSIQPHGVLLGLDPQGIIRYCSANVAGFSGREPSALLAQPLAAVHPELFSLINEVLHAGEDLPRPLRVEAAGKPWDVFGITNGENIFVLELEESVPVNLPVDALFDQTAAFVTHIERARSLQDLCQRVAEQTRAITGYDRVMIYRFDKDYNGEVYAESREASMEPFLNLHYPHTDIPVQARELYLRNPLRLIADVHYEPVPLLTADDGTAPELDLGTARLRSVSPIHLQYLKNMGVGATLTISLISEGRLWGLIACHHRGPKHLGHLQRKAALLQGHFLSSQINVRQVAEEFEVHQVVEAHLQQLLFAIGQEGDFAARFNGLSSLVPVANATGVALLHQGKLYQKGFAPDPERTRHLLQWLADTYSGVQFVSENLAAHYPDAWRISTEASGILYHKLGDPRKEAIIWFREERERVINWAGNPREPAKRSPVTNMLQPRTSFALFREQVKHHSLPWRVSEVNAATRFAAALQNVFHLEYLKAEEANHRVLNEKLVKANEELANINWITTHDLKEPIRKILVFASRVMDEEGRSLSDNIVHSLGRIQQSAQRMRSLVEDLMAYRLLDNSESPFVMSDLNDIVASVLEDFADDLREKGIRVVSESLPVLPMIPYQARQLFSNLIGNAVKFSIPGGGGIIELHCEVAPGGSFHHPTRASTGDFYLIRVRDTGIGFDPVQSSRIFNIFYRLHDSSSLYTGTGIGLAICKRITENHGGFITAAGAPNEGATFSIYLPRDPSGGTAR
ncbi:GAF domain-containing protein [Flaviaesturariibacter flavus]|uniref:histidine kinase n=1 Tax=Flaviaesturariibacter flavus TaxID=2502780 RepID=A0A4R1BMT9_9BACT|nr:ATP-binding protein [Flaviaesturariibacter flavus]TCJ18638.1 GAF domain-containing protein [Flaviaesturariibacter flavus]